MKLYAYARYSSDNQRAESIDEQLREINDYCDKNGHIIISKYCDYARSGKYDNRPEYEKMLKDCITDSNCDGVIVFDITRFSRGGELGIVDSVTLSTHGKALVSATEQIDGDDFSGKIVKYFKFLMAEEDLTKLSNNVKRGKRETALACEWNGGTPPLGYDVVAKKLVINEKEAEAVRIIFNRISCKASYMQVIDELNSLGFITKTGGQFKKTSIFEILHNKKYIGIWEFGKIITVKDPVSKTCRTYQAEPEDIITHINACEPIITQELFDKVQAVRGTRKQSSKAKVKYNLTGLTTCACCGGGYVGSSGSSHGKRDYYYICNGRKNGRTCDNRNIKKDILEEAVIRNVIEHVKSGAFFNDFCTLIEEHNKSTNNTAISTANNRLDNQIKANDTRVRKAKEAYLNSIFTLEEYTSEQYKRDKHNAELRASKIIPKYININKKTLKQACDGLSKRVNTSNALALVDNIIIHHDTITVNFASSIMDEDNDGGADGSRTRVQTVIDITFYMLRSTI